MNSRLFRVVCTILLNLEVSLCILIKMYFDHSFKLKIGFEIVVVTVEIQASFIKSYFHKYLVSIIMYLVTTFYYLS